MNTRRTERHAPDLVLLGTILTLSIFGLLMVFSASMSERREPTYFFFHQLQNFLIGLVLLAAIFMVDYRRWRNWVAYAAFVLAAVLLLGVEFFGINVEGAQRWLFNRSFQPSEFAKLAVILFAAEWLPRKGDDVRTLGYGLIPFGILMGSIVSLVVREPDLGTAAVIMGTAGLLFLISGADIIQSFLAAGLAGSVLFLTAHPYQLTRMAHFWDPCSDEAPEKLLQVCQGLIAMGSGGLIGLGVGSSRFRWDLHAPYSDSIMGIIGEELGLFGTVFVIILFAVFLYRGFSIAMRTADSFGRLTAVGISLWVGIQAAINLAANTAMIPFTGVPLPFISFGGSSLISLMIASGILLNISRNTQEVATSTRGPLQRTTNAPTDHGGRNRGPRLPGSGGR